MPNVPARAELLQRVFFAVTLERVSISSWACTAPSRNVPITSAQTERLKSVRFIQILLLKLGFVFVRTSSKPSSTLNARSRRQNPHAPKKSSLLGASPSVLALPAYERRCYNARPLRLQGTIGQPEKLWPKICRRR